MSTVAERTRAAMDAATSHVDSAPPLPLPPPLSWAPRASRRRWHALGPRRRWGAWLTPLAAAAAVIAFAVSLVAVRGTPGGYTPVPATSPVIAPGSVPQYYLTFSQPAGDTTKPVGLELRQTLTGKTLSTLQPPQGLSFAGITGAADDRTFVASAHRDPYGVTGSMARSRAWYLVRVAGTGSGASLTMTKLPIPATQVGAEVLGIALSPDGTKLAVGTTPWTTNINVRQTLRVYSVDTGAVLRTWTTPPGQDLLQAGGGYAGDANTSLAWVGNDTLAYLRGVRATGVPAFDMQVMLLDVSRPDGDLLGSSRATIMMPVSLPDPATPASFGCGLGFRFDVFVTGDGKSFVCGGTGATGASLPESLCAHGSAWNTLAFGEYSFSGGPVRYIGYRTTCNSLAVVAYPLWVNATGSTIIGWMHFANSIPGKFGVFSNGSFRPLPIPVPGNWYQWDEGSLLSQVAW
jgi:hypothetical protein